MLFTILKPFFFLSVLRGVYCVTVSVTAERSSLYVFFCGRGFCYFVGWVGGDQDCFSVGRFLD